MEFDRIGMEDDTREEIAALYRKHWPKLYAHACALLGDEDGAKDAVSDVFCSMLEAGRYFPSGQDLLPLFYTMVRNRCIDHLRRRRTVEKHCSSYVEELYAGWTTDDYRAHEERISRMQHSIRQMAPQMRTVVEEFFLNEKKCAEIGEQLQISDNTVRTHIARALKILRQRLKIGD